MNANRSLLALTIGCFALAGAASAQDRLQGTTWTLYRVSQVAGGPAETIPARGAPSLSFQASRAQGNTGCNSFSGPYQVVGSALKVGSLIATKRACADPAANAREARFLNGLAKARRFAVTAGLLALYTTERETLVFRPAAPPTGGATGPDPEALHASWTLLQISSGGTTDSTPTDRPPTLTLDGQRAGGFGGCNQFGASYTVTGQQLRFSDIVSTLMLCGDERRDALERRFTGLLGEVERFEIAGDRLTLSTAAGDTLVFRKG